MYVIKSRVDSGEVYGCALGLIISELRSRKYVVVQAKPQQKWPSMSPFHFLSIHFLLAGGPTPAMLNKSLSINSIM